MEGGEIVQVGTPQDIVLNPSSDYVRDFVAHMNPLNVLRAQEVMVPFASICRRRSPGEARIDEDLTLTAAGEAGGGATRCRSWRSPTSTARRTGPSSRSWGKPRSAR